MDRHVHLEGDLARVGPVHRHPPQAPAIGDHDRRAVRRERVPWEKIQRGPALHVIALDRVLQPPFVTAGQVAGAETGGILVTAPVDQGGTVGRHGGTEARPVATGHCRAPPRLAVVARELVLGKGGVVVPVASPLCQVDIASRRVERGSDGFEVVRLVDQGDSAPTPAVKQPRLGGPAERAVGARRHQVFAVRRPLG